MIIKKAMPFLDKESTEEVYDMLLEKEKYDVLDSIAYSLSEEQVQTLFALYIEKDRPVNKLLPFVGKEFLKQKVLEEIDKL